VKLFREFMKFLAVYSYALQDNSDNALEADRLAVPPLISFIWRMASLNHSEYDGLCAAINGQDDATSIPFKASPESHQDYLD
jgi:hypothetical protein